MWWLVGVVGLVGLSAWLRLAWERRQRRREQLERDELARRVGR